MNRIGRILFNFNGYFFFALSMVQANRINPVYRSIMVVAILIAVLPPLLAFVSGYFSLREQLDTQASRQATFATQFLAKQVEGEKLAQFFPHLQANRQADGVWHLSEAETSFSITSSAAIQFRGRELGQLSLQASLYPLLLNSAIILILILFLEGVFWYFLRGWEQAMFNASANISLEKLRSSPEWLVQEEEHQRLLREHDAHVTAMRACAAENQEQLAMTRQMKLEWDENVSKITQGLEHQAKVLLQEKALRLVSETESLAKTHFFGELSHDLRIALNGIADMNAMLLDSGLSAHQRECVQAIQQSSTTLLHFADALLDYSRFERDDLELNKAAFSPSSLLESCVDMLAPYARQKELVLTCTVDEKLASSLVGDVQRLQLILMNFGSNALKFANSGVVQFSARSLAKKAGRQRLRLEVQDSGCGIAPEVQQKLLAENIADSKRGLGLSVCLRLAHLMHGELGLHSVTDDGSRFWLELDLPISKQPVADPWGRARKLQTHLQGRRVLVVHAHEQESMAICAMLEPLGIGVARVEQAVAALQLFQREHDFDIAIVAAQLPDMGGNALAVAFSTMAPKLKLILLTEPMDRRVAANESDLTNFHASLQLPLKPGKVFDALLFALGIEGQAIAKPTGPRPATSGVIRAQAKLLLVEDNPINQKLGLIQLRKLGYQVELASNGQQALFIWQKEQFDLILMDCEMPLMSGFAATAAIRLQEAQEERLPVAIVAMTANAMSGDRERCLAAGMDDYITKPISAEVLQQVIVRHLPHRGVGAVSRSKDEVAAVDLSLLTDICNGDHKTIFAFLDQYVLATDILLSKIGEAIAAKQMPQLRALNHELSGTSANLGVRLMHVLNTSMSSACSEDDFERAEYLYAQMQEAMHAVREFVANRA